MDLALSCLLLVLAVTGIVLLCRAKRGKPRKTPYVIGVVCLGILAAAAVFYLAATLVFIGGIA